MIVRAAPPEHLPWIAKRANLVISPQLNAIEAIDEMGQIRGMVAYDGWTHNACQIHIALDTPAALRHLIKPGFSIPFDAFHRGVVVGAVLSNNEAALKLNRHLGFKEVGRIPEGWAQGVDLVLMTMRREECRWLDKEAA